MARFIDTEREHEDITDDRDSFSDFKCCKVDVDEESCMSSSTISLAISDTGFTAGEMKERCNLFLREFDQEELHDKVLVLQVMPDDYEFQELRGHLEVYKHESDEPEKEAPRKAVCAADLEDEGSEHLQENYPSEWQRNGKPFACSSKNHCGRTISEFPGEASLANSDRKVMQDEDENESGSDYGVMISSREASSAENDVVGKETAVSRRKSDAIIEVKEHSECYIDSENPTPFSVHEEFAEASFTESIHEQCIPREDDTGSDDDGETRSVHVIRERRFYVHGCWLAVNSRYFRSLLYASGMKESSSQEFIMKVTESEEDAFVVLVESIYNAAALDVIDVNTLLSVLQLSQKYDVRFSFRKAKRVLRAMPLTLDVCETIIDAMSNGGLSDLDDVMESVEDLIFREFTPLDETWESDKYLGLSAGALRILLASDKLVVQSENTVFVSLMRWIEKNSEVYGDLVECSDLLSMVRFELMKPTYLNDVVRVHHVATQLDNFDATYLAAITWHALPTKRRTERGIPTQRCWCEAMKPTYMWILDPDEEMFVFEGPTNTRKSLSFWYYGYKMHLCLTMSPKTKGTRLSLVVENIAVHGSVKLAYDVDVKFSDGLHKTYTCSAFEYRGVQPYRGQYPFDKKYLLEEIKEILLGGSVKVTIIFEISIEKLVDE